VTSLQLFLRGLFLQTGWNRERMQALGFTFALLPLADGRDGDAQAAFVRRHLGYVNTSPALSGVLLGVVAGEEERLRAQGAAADEAAARVAAVKRQLEGPLAALGDRTFWGWLRPLAGVAGALLLLLQAGMAALAGPIPQALGRPAAMASVLLMLGFYNGPYLAVRWHGTRRGLAGGGDAAAALSGAGGPLGLARLNALLEIVGPITVGALAGCLIHLARIGATGVSAVRAGGAEVVPAQAAGAAVGVALVLGGLLVGAGASRFRQPPERTALALIAFLLLAGGGAG
jgi:mannose/fructose/N-acetylgalactosamine-specific phosphotransferase system component IID